MYSAFKAYIHTLNDINHFRLPLHEARHFNRKQKLSNPISRIVFISDIVAQIAKSQGITSNKVYYFEVYIMFCKR